MAAASTNKMQSQLLWKCKECGFGRNVLARAFCQNCGHVSPWMATVTFSGIEGRCAPVNGVYRMDGDQADWHGARPTYVKVDGGKLWLYFLPQQHCWGVSNELGSTDCVLINGPDYQAWTPRDITSPWQFFNGKEFEYNEDFRHKVSEGSPDCMFPDDLPPLADDEIELPPDLADKMDELQNVKGLNPEEKEKLEEAIWTEAEEREDCKRKELEKKIEQRAKDKKAKEKKKLEDAYNPNAFLTNTSEKQVDDLGLVFGSVLHLSQDNDGVDDDEFEI